MFGPCRAWRNLNQSQTSENRISHKNLDFSLLLKIISSGDVGPAFPSGDNLQELSDGWAIERGHSLLVYPVIILPSTLLAQADFNLSHKLSDLEEELTTHESANSPFHRRRHFS